MRAPLSRLHVSLWYVAPFVVTFAFLLGHVARGRQQPPPLTRTGATAVAADRLDVSPALISIPPVLTEGAGVQHPVRRIPMPPRPARGRAARPIDVSIQSSATSAQLMLDPMTQGKTEGLHRSLKTW
jgi:hypothetical protein